MPADISSLNGAVFNALDTSQLLTIGNGLTQTGTTYVVSPKGSLGLAVYDNWNTTGGLPSISNPDVGDAVSYTTFFPTPMTPGVVEYKFTTGNGQTNPAAGGIGAEVVAYNATGVLLEQLPGYIPGTNPILTPGSTPEYFIVTDPGVDLSVYSAADINNFVGEQATAAELTFSTTYTGPFPTFAPAAVPEPSTVLMMPFMVVALLALRIPAVRSLLRAR